MTKTEEDNYKLNVEEIQQILNVSLINNSQLNLILINFFKSYLSHLSL